MRQNVYMRVISLKILRQFWSRHPDTEFWLRRWYKTATQATWTSIQDVRRDYPHADGASTRQGDLLTVFNVSGNKYRLVTRVRYDYQLINIRAVLTHAEYDKGQWKD
jgi:mRNA interferase HigB